METQRMYRIPARMEECPWCGNETLAKAMSKPQKCQWCRRMFVVNNTKKKNKWIWNLECTNFDGPRTYNRDSRTM